MQHKNRIMKIAGYSADEFYELEYLVTKNIRFMNHLLIEETIIAKAETRLSNIDIDDAPFIAMTDYLKAKLWTGDKKLQNALNKQGYRHIITTNQLLEKIKR
jgi:predicted nucleic acid-binding protein